jgi:glutathione S-transferase
MDSPAFQAYALASAFLVVQLLFLAFWTGAVRTNRKQYVLPEDKAVIKGQRADADHPDVLRVKAAHVNALENAVPFFIIGGLYLATGATKVGAQAYYFTFLGARLLHTVFYLSGLQPWRTIAFAVGAMSILGMAVHVIRAVI